MAPIINYRKRQVPKRFRLPNRLAVYIPLPHLRLSASHLTGSFHVERPTQIANPICEEVI